MKWIGKLTITSEITLGTTEATNASDALDIFRSWVDGNEAGTVTVRPVTEASRGSSEIHIGKWC